MAILGVSILEVFGIAAVIVLVIVGLLIAYVAYHIWKFKRAMSGLGIAMKELGETMKQGVVPDSLDLEPADDDAHGDVPEAMEARRQLEYAGLRFGGCYSSSKMPGVILSTFADPERGVMAAVANAGAYGLLLDVVTMYEDGSAVTHRTLPSLGLDYPPQFKSVQVSNVGAGEMLERHLAERDDKPYRKFEPEDVADAMEEFNHTVVQWRTQRGGLSEDEVRRNLQITGTQADDDAIKMVVAASRIEAERRSKEGADSPER